MVGENIKIYVSSRSPPPFVRWYFKSTNDIFIAFLLLLKIISPSKKSTQTVEFQGSRNPFPPHADTEF